MKRLGNRSCFGLTKPHAKSRSNCRNLTLNQGELSMSFLALITPLSSTGEPTHPIYNPPGIWPSPGVPTHPIAPGGPPPQIWPSPGYPSHPIAGPPPGIWPSPGHPAHPIAPGGPPPGIWPSPGYPSHPIAPGGPPPGFWGGVAPPYVDIGGPGQQPGIWPSPGVPTHPIVLPPDLPPTLPDPDNRPIDWKTVWSPSTGWVVVGVPSGPSPTPSKK
jgi:hypothetical protein